MPATTKKPAAKNATAARYDALVAEGRISDDSSQRAILPELEALSAALASKKGGLGRLLKKSGDAPKGLYIWGSVGRGKSMLMDLFFEHVAIEKKRRVHFHAFMQEVHARLHALRKEGKRGKDGADPVIVLAQQIAQETSLLCFDELQATDVADATLLYRLFHALFAGGVTVVSTSNRPPGSLYTGGVQRERFAKFIELVEGNMKVLPLTSPTDYRATQLQSMEKRYHYPLGAEAAAFIEEAIQHLSDGAPPKKDMLVVHGRKIAFNLYNDSMAYFTFHDLCEKTLGAADYLALARRCDVLILSGIPRLSAEKRNEAKRFVTLIDALYEHKVKLICTADAPPEEIYAHGDGTFEFTRTVSRMKEMQSVRWGTA